MKWSMSDEILKYDIAESLSRLERMSAELSTKISSVVNESPKKVLAVPYDTASTVSFAEIRQELLEDFNAERGCDRLDYSVAALSGVIAGIIDVLWVGMPGASEIGQGVDKATDKLIIRLSNLIARPVSKKGKRVKPTDKVEIAISRLEQVFKVNYDQRHASDVGGLVGLTPINHHLLSLAHSPDWIGLLASVVSQFCDVSFFVDDGRLIRIDTKTFELHGKNVATKLFCAVCNWLGHILSDVAGSTSSRMKGEGHRGMGIGAPFYWLTQFVDIGEFGKNRESFAKLAADVFESGYDLRHFAACAVPVVLNELVVRLFWALRQRFGKKRPFRDCIPSQKHPAVNRMLLVSYATFCAIDAMDAAIRSDGMIFLFLMRCNLAAWYRFASVSVREVDFFLDRDRQLLEFHAIRLERETERIATTYGISQEEVDAVMSRFYLA